MHEIRYCAFAVQQKKGDKERSIEFVYPVISISLKQRKNILREQAGAKPRANSLNKEYWLIQLGQGKKIISNVKVSALRDRNFKFRLIGLGDLEKSKDWDDLSDHYAFL